MRKSTALVITATLWAMVSAAAQIASGQTAAPKTAEEVYKNIVQLKGTPADQLLPAMQFIAASLNVECSFCHVQGKMEADDKPEKKTAREMIAMMMAINKDSFNGRQEISCYSCHHGAEHPAGVPPVRESDTPDVEAKAPAPNGATPGRGRHYRKICCGHRGRGCDAEDYEPRRDRIDSGGWEQFADRGGHEGAE